MPTEAQFFAEILHNLSDPAPRLVFADWLEEHGDSRADGLRLQCQIDSLPPGTPARLPLIERREALLTDQQGRVAKWVRHFAMERIKIKLNRLRKLDDKCELFGAKKHQYRLQPCLTEATIASFELRYEITLPVEYREFLLLVSGGGAGPYYGLEPLPTEHADWMDEIKTPFDYSSQQALEMIRSGEYVEDGPEFGCLMASEVGCGGYNLLVISGEQSGRMWFTGDRAGPISDKDGQQVGFLAWYEEWLDYNSRPEVLEHYRTRFRK